MKDYHPEKDPHSRFYECCRRVPGITPTNLKPTSRLLHLSQSAKPKPIQGTCSGQHPQNEPWLKPARLLAFTLGIETVFLRMVRDLDFASIHSKVDGRTTKCHPPTGDQTLGCRLCLWKYPKWVSTTKWGPIILQKLSGPTRVAQKYLVFEGLFLPLCLLGPRKIPTPQQRFLEPYERQMILGGPLTTQRTPTSLICRQEMWFLTKI